MSIASGNGTKADAKFIKRLEAKNKTVQSHPTHEYLDKLYRIDEILKLVGVVLLVGIALTLILFGPRAQENKVPELTPEDRAELEQIDREIESIRKEMEEVYRLMRMQREGKLWSA